jgi:hypothetical protein
MDADKQLVFIGVDRRSSAAIGFFLGNLFNLMACPP